MIDTIFYPGVCLVYSDSTRRSEHAHICETSQRVANSELDTFFGCKVDFLATEQLSWAQTKAETPSYCMQKKNPI